MPFVRFFEDTIVRDEYRHDPEKRTVFLAGLIYEMSDASVQHWLVRNKIEIVEPPQEEAAIAEEQQDEGQEANIAKKRGKKSS